MGRAAFGLRRGGSPLQQRLRAPHGRPAQSKRGYALRSVPAAEWITIAVPALVDAALFAAVTAQLQENRQRARIPQKGSRYLLQGLLVCAECGYAYHGRVNNDRNAYYRCGGSLPQHGTGARVCWNKAVRMDEVDPAIWQAVGTMLQDPEHVAEEYRRRVQPPQPPMNKAVWSGRSANSTKAWRA